MHISYILPPYIHPYDLTQYCTYNTANKHDKYPLECISMGSAGPTGVLIHSYGIWQNTMPSAVPSYLEALL